MTLLLGESPLAKARDGIDRTVEAAADKRSHLPKGKETKMGSNETAWDGPPDQGEMEKSVVLLTSDAKRAKLAEQLPGQNADDIAASLRQSVVKLAKAAETAYLSTDEGSVLLAEEPYSFGYIRLVPTVLLPILADIAYQGEVETVTCDNCQHVQTVSVKGYPPTWETPDGETAEGLTLLYGANLVNLWDAPERAERTRSSGTIALPPIGSQWQTVEYKGRNFDLSVVADGKGGRKIKVGNPPPQFPVAMALTSVSMVARELIMASHHGEPEWTTGSDGLVPGPKGRITLRSKASRNGREFCQLDKAGNILPAALLKAL